MTQTPRHAAALFSQLLGMYTDQLELPHIATVHATKNNFLTGIDDVFCIMVHETDGSIARNRAKTWYDDYRRASGEGGGPQLVIWADGTVMSLVELPYRTTHGNSQNDRAVGIETGHGNDGRYGDVDVAPDASAGHTVRKAWHELSPHPEDVAGSASAKFFVMDAPYAVPSSLPADYPTFQSEVVAAPWSTNNYRTPAREPPGPQHGGMYATLIKKGGLAPPQPTLMVFTEWHYRSWALLARYLCEALLVPRNFPVWPHARRDHSITDHTAFQQIVLADEHFGMIVDALGKSEPHGGRQLQFTDADFTGGTPADATNLQNHYHAAVAGQGSFNIGAFQNVRLNLAWWRFFDFYRGIHGHAFSGNQIVGQDDHDCPGPMFDWHRFAREVWDWWWWPFDFDSMHARTDVPDRPYRRADSSTPLVEYFFYVDGAPYDARAAAPGGIQGAGSSPATFRLEEHSPVYALANGELVAARYPTAGQVSMAFVLVRHEIFHRLDPEGIERSKGVVDPKDAGHGGRADTGRLDYNVEPTTVYALYMHLGRHDQMNFGQVNDHNPDWLNRVLIRMTECDLALPPTAPGTLHPQLNHWSADLTQPPSTSGDRPTPLQAWQQDQADYRRFLTQLAAGQVAMAPLRSPLDSIGPTPVRVILGDYLGVAGVIRQEAGVPTFGVRVEVFSPQVPDNRFTPVYNRDSWDVPGGVTHPVLYYQSEWARTPSPAETTELQELGVDPAAVTWWPDVPIRQFWDLLTPPNAKLPLDGFVYHYAPIDFMQWLNDLTWSSEWPKYKVMTTATPPAPVARPPAPRPRRF